MPWTCRSRVHCKTHRTPVVCTGDPCHSLKLGGQRRLNNSTQQIQKDQVPAQPNSIHCPYEFSKYNPHTGWGGFFMDLARKEMAVSSGTEALLPSLVWPSLPPILFKLCPKKSRIWIQPHLASILKSPHFPLLSQEPSLLGPQPYVIWNGDADTDVRTFRFQVQWYTNTDRVLWMKRRLQGLSRQVLGWESLACPLQKSKERGSAEV